MDVLNRYSLTSIDQIANRYLSNNKNIPINNSESSVSFEEIFKAKQKSTDSELKFSKHASMRLIDRNIELTNNQLERLEHGKEIAKQKGINESLMIMDNLAFIINVKNNTVVTAVDQNSSDSKVFTNIDGAVIV